MKKNILLFQLLIFFYVSGNAQIINASSFYNKIDVTADLQAAIDSSPDKIIIPFMGEGTKWISGPLNLKSNIEIFLEPGVILQAKKDAFTNSNLPPPFDIRISFINIIYKRNIKISGGKGAQILMNIDEYTKGEWRHAINILESNDIIIKDLKISKSGGDGIYLGKRLKKKNNKNGCRRVTIKNVHFDGNARTGIAIISAGNINIENCYFTNTGKHNSPGLANRGTWSGIDIEPNESNVFLEKITINNCFFSNNYNPSKKKGRSIYVFLKHLNKSTNISIHIINNHFENYFYAVSLRGLQSNLIGGIINIENNYSENTEKLVTKKETKNDKSPWTNTIVTIQVNGKEWTDLKNHQQISHSSFVNYFHEHYKEDKKIEDFLTHKDSKIYTGDFNGDKKNRYPCDRISKRN